MPENMKNELNLLELLWDRREKNKKKTNEIQQMIRNYTLYKNK